MARKERIPEPLDSLTAMVAFLKNNLPKEKINFGKNRIIITEEEIEQACEKYNNKIAKTKDNNLE